MLRNPFDWLRSLRAPRKRTKPLPKRKFYPELEPLERRMMPTTVQFSGSPYSIVENGGSATVTVTLDQASSDTVTVNYTTSNGTAAAGLDFTSAFGTLTFNPNDTSKTFSVTITSDAADENDETINLTLSSPTYASLGSPYTATLTITDDDPEPAVAFTSSSYSGGESTGKATITAVLSAGSGKTVTVNYATSAGSATAGTDYTETSGTLTFNAGQTSKTFDVWLTDDETSESSETVTVTLSSPANATLGSPSSGTLTIINEAPTNWTVTGRQRTTDPEQGFLFPFGQDLVAPQEGATLAAHPLDFRRSLPGPYDAWSAVGVPPALVYNSGTVNVKPILETTLAGMTAWATTVSEIKLRLTWNGGAPQSWVTFGNGMTGSDATVIVAQQLSSTVASTGVYSWSLDLVVNFTNRGPVNRAVSGTTAVVVNDNSDADPFGYGWGLAGFDKLVADGSSGMLWVTGTGGTRYFSGSGSPTPFTYTSPANDFGALVKNANGSFTYTAKNQVKKDFDSAGKLTGITSPHGLARNFAYASSKLSTVTEPDGAVATFTYSSNLLSKIEEVGSRAVTVTLDGSGNLTELVNPDAGRHSFTYDSVHRLTNDRFGPLSTTMVYDATHGRLTSLDRGLGSTLAVAPAATQGLTTSAAPLAVNVVGKLTDALGYPASYVLDSLGRPTKVVQYQSIIAGAYAFQWDRNSAGQVTRFTDPLDRATTYTYDAAGDLTRIDHPDGSNAQFQYHGTFHTPTRIQDTLNHVTTLTYDGTAGDLTSIKDANNKATTFTWSSGLLQTVQDARGNTTSFQYYAGNRRLEAVLDAQSTPGRTTFTYDAAGNTDTIQDALGRTTTTVFDGLRRLTELRDAAGGTTTLTYNAIGGVTSQIDALGRTTSFTYDARGFQTRLTEALGTSVERTTTFTVDVRGRTTTVIDPLNHSTTITYDNADNVRAVQNAVGSLVTYTYDLASQLTAVQDPNGNTTNLTYTSRGWVETVSDALSNVTTFAYDTEGNLTALENALDQRTTFTYDPLNRLETTKDALNYVTTFVYDDVSNLIRVIDARGNSTTFAYDSVNRLTDTVFTSAAGAVTITNGYDKLGNLTSVTDGNGNPATFVYDNLNRVTKIQGYTDANGLVTSVYDYDAVGNVTMVTDANNNATTFGYDALDRLTRISNALGNATTVVYDAADNVTSLIDPLGNRTTFTYDDADRLLTRKNALNNVVTLAYDAASNLVNVIDARGNKTTFVYDTLNRLSETVDAVGNTATTAYDAAGNVVNLIDARGNRTTLTYDAVNQLTARKDALNHTLTLVYDAVGNVSRSVDALNHSSTFTYDEANRLRTATVPSGGVTSYVYDKAGNLTGLLDGNNNPITYTFDKLNRPIETKLYTAATGVATTTIGYDKAGNVTMVLDATNNRTTFVYDSLNRLTEEKDPLNKSITYAYDAGDRLTSRTDRLGRRRDFTYDNTHRLLTEAWITGGSTVNTLTYTYDANSNLLTGADADGTYTFTYDNVDRVATQKDLWNLTLTFAYDATHNRTKVEDSFGGVTTSTYNAGHLLTKREFGGSGQTPLRIDLTYTNRDQLDTVTRYSDLAGTSKIGSSTFTYDTTGRLSNLQHRNGGGTLLGNFTYTYDLGNRLDTEVTNGTTKTYAYDKTDQLLGDGANTHTYDQTGNRTTTGYQTGTANRLTNDGTWTYTYDDEGNRATKSKGASLERWTYTFDQWNQLTKAEKRDGADDTVEVRVEYKFDVFGQRIERTLDPDGDTGPAATTTTRYAYDDRGDLWADLNTSNQLQVRYLRGDIVDQLFARISSGTAAWYLPDRLGSVRNIVDAGGALVATLTYDAFGQLTSAEDSDADRFQYTGLEWDKDVKLQHSRAREYDPATGRFLQEDPIGFAAGDTNPTRYVFNSPTNFTDPSGLEGEAAGTSGPAAAPGVVFVITESQGPLTRWWEAAKRVVGLGKRAAGIAAETTVQNLANAPQTLLAIPGNFVEGLHCFSVGLAYIIEDISNGDGAHLQAAGESIAEAVKQTAEEVAEDPVAAAARAAGNWLSSTFLGMPLAGMAGVGGKPRAGGAPSKGTPGGPTPSPNPSGPSPATPPSGATPASPPAAPKKAPSGTPDGICFVAGTPVLVTAEFPSVPPEVVFVASDALEYGPAGIAILIGFVGWRQLDSKSRRKRRPGADQRHHVDLEWMEEDNQADDESYDTWCINPRLQMRMTAQCCLSASTPPRKECTASRKARASWEIDPRDHIQFLGVVESSADSRRGSPVEKPDQRHVEQNWFGRSWLIAWLMLGSILAGWPLLGLSSPHTSHETSGTSQSAFKPIETVRAGDRVWTANAARELVTSAVEPTTWRRLKLRAETVWPDGTLDVVNVETLRPPQWAAGATVGASVPLPLDLLELGLPEDLRAEVLANEPCPPISAGPGHVVLTTLDHLNNDVRELTVVDDQGRRESFRPTGRHKLYREPDGAWVPAARFVPGDHLRGRSGPLTLLANQRVPGVHRVYNLSVEGEHVYHVSILGVLAHNNGSKAEPLPDQIYRKGGSNPGNLKTRPGEEGISGRDSLSNPYPLKPGEKPVFGADDPYIVIDPKKLPPGSVIPDNVPPGHVTIKGLDPETIKKAIVGKGVLPVLPF